MTETRTKRSWFQALSGIFGRGRQKLMASSVLVLLRLSIGWMFLYAGVDHLLTEISTGKMATTGYLLYATKGPFQEFFSSLSGNTIVNGFVVWGLILVGLALILGVLVRFSSVMGSVMAILFYLSAFPPEHNPFMDDHIISVLVFAALAIFGAGRILGLDYLLERIRIVQRWPRLKILLG